MSLPAQRLVGRDGHAFQVYGKSPHLPVTAARTYKHLLCFTTGPHELVLEPVRREKPTRSTALDCSGLWPALCKAWHRSSVHTYQDQPSLVRKEGSAAPQCDIPHTRTAFSKLQEHTAHSIPTLHLVLLYISMYTST